MAVYITRQEVENLLSKKVDKFSIKDDLSTTADEEVLSTNGIKKELAEVKYPAELCDCLKEFDHMYLGWKDIHPTMDIDGRGLSKGLMYFNSLEKQLYVFDGSTWVRTLSSVPFSIPRETTLQKFDVEVQSTTTVVQPPNGYDPQTVNVYLNGVRMSADDYTATDGQTIQFTNPVYANDVVSGFSSADSGLTRFDVEVLAPTQTITIPNGYDPKTVNVYLNGIRMTVGDFTASDGSTITFKTPPLQVNDVVSGYSMQYTPASASIITEYAKIEDAPNPTINGSLGWDISRQKLFFYSATSGAWVGKDTSTQGNIEFHDKFEEFPDRTVAKLDTLYIDRNTKAFYLFDGTIYQRHGIVVDEPLPSQGSVGALYVDTINKKIRYWNGTSYQTLIEGGDEIQKATSTSDFIVSGREKLFIDTTTNIAYHYNGFDFIPLSSAGVGGVKVVNDTSEVISKNTAYYKEENGKLYYFDGEIKRLNKEFWRVANDADLQNTIKDEDFIYLVDTTNILKKWDNAHSRFETLGSSKVIHTFLKASEVATAGEYPTKAEIETAIAPKGYTDMLVWGSGSNMPSHPPKWVYSIDETGEALLVYAKVSQHCEAYAVSNNDQDIGNNQLKIKVLGGNNVTITDGNGVVLDFGDKESNIRLSGGEGVLSIYIGGVKIPNHFITLSGDKATIDTSKAIADGKIYKDTYIEIVK